MVLDLRTLGVLRPLLWVLCGLWLVKTLVLNAMGRFVEIDPVLAISIAIASCGSDVDDQNIEGIWMMPCSQSRGEVLSNEAPDITYYSGGNMQFAEGIISGSGVEYTDSECTLPVINGGILYIGLDRLRDPSQTPDTPAEEELLDFDYPLLRTQSENLPGTHTEL